MVLAQGLQEPTLRSCRGLTDGAGVSLWARATQPGLDEPLPAGTGLPRALSRRPRGTRASHTTACHCPGGFAGLSWSHTGVNAGRHGAFLDRDAAAGTCFCLEASLLERQPLHYGFSVWVVPRGSGSWGTWRFKSPHKLKEGHPVLSLLCARPAVCL